MASNYWIDISIILFATVEFILTFFKIHWIYISIYLIIPCITLLIAWMYWAEMKESKITKAFIITIITLAIPAFIFCSFGDLFLGLFSDMSSKYIMIFKVLGTLSFLIAQILFIISYFSYLCARKKEINLLKTILVCLIGFSLLAFLIYVIILPLEFLMMIVCFIYCVSALVPFFLTSTIWINFPHKGTFTNFLGTAIFVFSDSLIGIGLNPSSPIPHYPFYYGAILLTYHLGLYLIGKGLVIRDKQTLIDHK